MLLTLEQIARLAPDKARTPSRRPTRKPPPSAVQGVRGFNAIATANNRDKGINELSSALKRRFNTVILPLPASEAEEVSIVTKRVAEMGRSL